MAAPTQITGCQLWLDGADSSAASMTLSSGNNVSVWKDKSGNGYNFTQASYATSSPPLTTITSGTGPYFGSFQALYNTTIPFPSTYTIFSVTNQTGSSGRYSYIMHAPYNADHVIFFGAYNGTHYFATFAGPPGSWNDVSANSPNTNIATTSNTASLLCCTNDGTTLTPYFNATAMATKTGTNATAIGMTLGDTAIGFSGQPWYGTIGEFIIFNSVLTITQRQSVEGYLAWKWGIQASLPSSHPYYAAAPTTLLPPPSCFTADSMILTPSGYKSADTIHTGDIVMTADGRKVPVKAYNATVMATKETAPFLIKKDAFALGCPKADLRLSPWHAIQTKPGVWMKPMSFSELYPGKIQQYGLGKPVTYYHFEAPNFFKDNLICDGTIVESYGGDQLANVKGRVYTFDKNLGGYTRQTGKPVQKKLMM